MKEYLSSLTRESAGKNDIPEYQEKLQLTQGHSSWKRLLLEAFLNMKECLSSLTRESAVKNDILEYQEKLPLNRGRSSLKGRRQTFFLFGRKCVGEETLTSLVAHGIVRFAVSTQRCINFYLQEHLKKVFKKRLAKR